jgi:Pyridoxamine 5'-phosphate oxidase
MKLVGGPLSREACLSLLGSAGLGRIAVTDGALPLILPVQYQLEGAWLLFCCGSRLGQERGPIHEVVAFEAGGLELSSFSGWTVQLQGLAGPSDHESSSSLAHCVRRRSEGAAAFSQLDAREAFGYYYDLCGDERSASL